MNIYRIFITACLTILSLSQSFSQVKPERLKVYYLDSYTLYNTGQGQKEVIEQSNDSIWQGIIILNDDQVVVRDGDYGKNCRESRYIIEGSELVPAYFVKSMTDVGLHESKPISINHSKGTVTITFKKFKREKEYRIKSYETHYCYDKSRSKMEREILDRFSNLMDSKKESKINGVIPSGTYERSPSFIRLEVILDKYYCFYQNGKLFSLAFMKEDTSGTNLYYATKEILEEANLYELKDLKENRSKVVAFMGRNEDTLFTEGIVNLLGIRYKNEDKLVKLSFLELYLKE